MKKIVSCLLLVVVLSSAVLAIPGAAAEAEASDFYYQYEYFIRTEVYPYSDSTDLRYLDCNGMLVTLQYFDYYTPTQRWKFIDYGSYVAIFCPGFGASGAYLSVSNFSYVDLGVSLSGAIATDREKWTMQYGSMGGMSFYNHYYGVYLSSDQYGNLLLSSTPFYWTIGMASV